jgi:hypothetical protein
MSIRHILELAMMNSYLMEITIGCTAISLGDLAPKSMAILGIFPALLRLSQRSDYLMPAAQRKFQYIMEHLPIEWLPKMKWA